MRITILVPDSLVHDELDPRNKNRSEEITGDLERYFYMMKRLQSPLRQQFSHAERMLIADVCNGVLWDVQTIALISTMISDECESSSLAVKHSVDGAALTTKLSALTLAEQFAMVDAIELFWRGAPAAWLPEEAE